MHLGFSSGLRIRVLDVVFVPRARYVVFWQRPSSVRRLLVVPWLSVVAHVADVPPGGGPRGCGGEGADSVDCAAQASGQAGLTTGVSKGLGMEALWEEDHCCGWVDRSSVVRWF